MRGRTAPFLRLAAAAAASPQPGRQRPARARPGLQRRPSGRRSRAQAQRAGVLFACLFAWFLPRVIHAVSPGSLGNRRPCDEEKGLFSGGDWLWGSSGSGQSAGGAAGGRPGGAPRRGSGPAQAPAGLRLPPACPTASLFRSDLPLPGRGPPAPQSNPLRSHLPVSTLASSAKRQLPGDIGNTASGERYLGSWASRADKKLPAAERCVALGKEQTIFLTK